MIEDDGETMAFQQGTIAETEVRVVHKEGATSVYLAARSGPFQPHPRRLTLQIHAGSRPTSLTLGGAEVAWEWDESRRAAILSWEDDGQAHEVVVRGG